MKYVLNFLDSEGESHFVAELSNPADVYKVIKKEIENINPNFKIYYFRSWGLLEKDGITYDFGSHSEFFILTVKGEF